jgi:hypothetical protein
MLPNKKMDSANETNHEAPPTTEPHVVVACPTCRTKFAVESTLVASFETPRFHCSRCDAVFELGAPLRSPQHAAPSQPPRWVLTDDISNSTTANDLINQTIQSRETTLKTTDFSLGAVAEEPPIPHHLEEVRPGLSLLGLRFSSKHLSPTAITHKEALGGEEPVQSPGSSEATAPTTEANSDVFSLFDTPPAASTETETLRRVEPDLTPPLKNEPRATPPQSVEQVPTSTERAPRVRGSSRWLGRLSPRSQSLTLLSSPIVATLALLATVGYSTYLAPRTVDSILGALTPSFISGGAAQLPPPELSVHGVSIEFIKTQSQERVGIVRGVVHNASAASLDDVQLEALGFDDQGEIVARSQAPLRSALAREKVSDLSLATVKKFQESLSARSATINPGEQVAFTIALLDAQTPSGNAPMTPEALRNIKFFSARVFSVKQ